MTDLLTRLLALAELAVDEALQFEYGDPEDRHIWRELQELKPLVAAALAQPEPEGFATLNWSEDRQPCEECRYNHCIAETPFGRFVISWKGWKDHSAVTVDEAPFGEWFECWDSVEKAKSACQAEYNRRLTAAVGTALAKPEPQGPTDERITSIAKAVQECARAWAPNARLLGNVRAEDIDDLCNAVLTRWGRPAIEPVPVSERLPGPEDCDAEGRCWIFDPGDRVSSPAWMLETTEELEWLKTQNKEKFVQTAQRGRLTWLPHWALPVPTTRSEEI